MGLKIFERSNAIIFYVSGSFLQLYNIHFLLLMVNFLGIKEQMDVSLTSSIGVAVLYLLLSLTVIANSIIFLLYGI